MWYETEADVAEIGKYETRAEAVGTNIYFPSRPGIDKGMKVFIEGTAERSRDGIVMSKDAMVVQLFPSACCLCGHIYRWRAGLTATSHGLCEVCSRAYAVYGDLEEEVLPFKGVLGADKDAETRYLILAALLLQRGLEVEATPLGLVLEDSGARRLTGQAAPPDTRWLLHLEGQAVYLAGEPIGSLRELLDRFLTDPWLKKSAV